MTMDPIRHSDDIGSFSEWLDGTARLFLDPQKTALGMRELATGLAAARASKTPYEWRRLVRFFRQHPLLKLLHEDPHTFRGFRKPRGYAGDAVLIDLIYGGGEGASLVAEATPLGQSIYLATMGEPAIAAARGRRDFLAHCIDEICRLRHQPHILSVACGHLREAPLSREFMAGRAGRFVALDQDRRSLKVVEKALSRHGVECVAASIEQLMDSSVFPGRFDFIYASGLYDYLDDTTGRRLLKTLSRMIQPGGRILVANFMPDIVDAGYMEAAMDWWLVYREAEQLLGLAEELPTSVSKRTFRDSFDHLAYLDLQFRDQVV